MGFVPCGAPLTLAFLPTQINIYFSASWIKWRCSAICSPSSITCSALLCQHVALSLDGLRVSHHSSITTRCWDTIWAGSAPSAQHHPEERTEKLSTRHGYSLSAPDETAKVVQTSCASKVQEKVWKMRTLAPSAHGDAGLFQRATSRHESEHGQGGLPNEKEGEPPSKRSGQRGWIEIPLSASTSVSLLLASFVPEAVTALSLSLSCWNENIMMYKLLLCN